VRATSDAKEERRKNNRKVKYKARSERKRKP
jgi:hypothetical protein